MQAEWMRDEPERQSRVVHGSLVFADVSGFTKLAERLARRGGKVGAEELVEVLDATTARLLGVASADGGQLLKFGGDAVLLLFTGREHEARACRAAVGMRGALREAWHLETSVGNVRLRVSQGIYSGAMHLFLVGRLHRELVLAGPAATAVDALEGAADANEVLVSPATAAAIDAGCVGPARAGGYLLRRAPAASPARLSPAVDATAVDLSLGVPVAIRDYLAAGGSDPEHRVITVAFVRINGLDDLLATGGLDEAAVALDDVVAHAQEVCANHAVTFLGTDVYHDGTKLFLAAGAPRASGRDEERMLRALRDIVLHPTPLALRAGVNRGRTFVHAVGPRYRRTYTVMGDATNLAARVMQHARAGTVLATPAVVDAASTHFTCTPVEPFRAKGKSKLVEAVEVGAPADRPGARPSLPFIGRERELAACLERVELARRGHGGGVEVMGDVGAGKSRLAEEVRTRASDFDTAVAVCDEYDADRPYHAVATLLRALLRLPSDSTGQADALAVLVAERAPQLAPWLPLVGDVLGFHLPATPEVSQTAPVFLPARIAHTVVELLSSSCDRPVLLVVEDAHWLDDASTDLLARIAAEATDRRWLVLTTRQPGTERGALPEGDHVARVALSALDATSVERLADAAAPGALLPHVLTTLTARSGGNPLHLLQLLEAAASDASAGVLPDRLEVAVTAQIDRLTPADRSVLRTVSVLGATFDVALARTALFGAAPAVRDDDVWARLDRFLAVDGLHARFRHALVRDVAYEGLPFRRRAELHALIATTLADRPDRDAHPDLLSLHWFLAGRREEAWRWSRVAGERAADVGATGDAVRLFARALEAAASLPGIPAHEVAAVAERLGDVAELAGEYDRAASAYRQARRLIGEASARLGELLRKEGWVRERSGRYELARQWYRRGIEACEAGGDDATTTRDRLVLSCAAAFAWQGRYKEAIRWARKVVDRDDACERANLARAYYLLDWALTDLGDASAHRYRQLALPIYEELGDLIGQANALNNAGVDAYYEGRWDEAVALWRRSQRARQRAGDLVHAADATNNIAEILSDQGHLDEAQRHFEQAVRVFRGAGYQAGIALATSNLGRVHARRGEFDRAHDLLADGHARFSSIGAERYALETRARVAECYALAHRAGDAIDEARAVLSASEGRAGTHLLRCFAHRMLAYGHAQRGEWGAAQAAASASVGLAGDAKYERALSLLCIADLAAATDKPDPSCEAEAAALLTELAVVTATRPAAAGAGCADEGAHRAPSLKWSGPASIR